MLVKEQEHKKRHVASSSSRGILYYRTCSKLEHNRRTCTKDAATLSN
jgi:hypothetical protein